MRSAGKWSFKRVAAYFLAWTAVGLFNFSRDLARRLLWHDPTPWVDLLISWMAGIYICAAFTPLILWLGNRWPIERDRWYRTFALHLLFSICFSVVELFTETIVFLQLGVGSSFLKGSFWDSFITLLIVGFHGNILMYWIVLGLQSGFHYYQRYRERELQASELSAQLVQAQLSALKMQLQPHFLFNTLNAIMVLVRQHKSREAEEMLARLSDLLRSVLEEIESQEVPLRRELEYLKLYLSIEQVRFQDRLHVEVSAPPEILDAAVPHMGLQPIVENAVRHGIGRSSAAGKIEIIASRINETLEIKVKDDGPGLPPRSLLDSRGIGLTNTRERLKQLYGESARLTLENGQHRGTVATMTLPYRPAKEVFDTQRMEIHAIDNTGR